MAVREQTGYVTATGVGVTSLQPGPASPDVSVAGTLRLSIIALKSSTVTVTAGPGTQVARYTGNGIAIEIWAQYGSSFATSGSGRPSYTFSASVNAVVTWIVLSGTLGSAAVNTAKTWAVSAATSSDGSTLAQLTTTYGMEILSATVVDSDTVTRTENGALPPRWATGMGSSTTGLALGVVPNSLIHHGPPSDINLVEYPSRLDDASYYVGQDFTFSASASAMNVAIGVKAITYEPVLLDDEFQFGNEGVRLNTGATALPVWDVERVEGLDSAQFRYSVDPRDGAHGAFVDARYYGERTIIVEGTLYCASADVDTHLDTMRASLTPSPTGTPKPFYYKLRGKTQRQVNVVPIGFKSDMSTNRAYGSVPFQLQFVAEDPFAYERSIWVPNTPPTTGTAATSVTVPALPTSGLAYYPAFAFKVHTGEADAGDTFTFTDSVTGNTVVVTGLGLSTGSTYILDFAARRLSNDAGDDFSGNITTRNWFKVGVVGSTQTVQLTRPTTTVLKRFSFALIAPKAAYQ